jgi:hypothetical protein
MRCTLPATIVARLATAVLLLPFTCTAGPAAAATNHYVCDCRSGADGDCVAGDDANAGTDPAAPWRTYARARSFYNSAVAAGDSILFCRGGVHDIGGDYDNQWSNTACTAGQPCRVADYTAAWASGDEADPVLERTSDGHGFTLVNDSGHEFANLDMRCSGCTGGSGWAFFIVEDADDILIDRVSMDGFTIGIHLRGCIATWCTNDRVTVRNSRFTNNANQGFLGHGNDLLLENNYFENNGDGTVFSHNIYVAGDSRVTIRNNELYRASLDAGGNCSGTSLVAHGALRDMVIEGNYVHEDAGKANQGCWGIGIAPAYHGDAEINDRLIVRGNWVENVGNVSIATGSCVDCILENNIIVQRQPFGTTGIAVRPFGIPGEDAVSSNITVRNNSISTTTGTGIELSEGSGHTIVSNAIRHFGSDANWACLETTLAASAFATVDHNICGYATGQWMRGVGDLAAWQATGHGANSQATDPGFASDTDLTPRDAFVALVDAGHASLSSSDDATGSVRDAMPDVGAFEYGSTAPPVTVCPIDPLPNCSGPKSPGGAKLKIRNHSDNTRDGVAWNWKAPDGAVGVAFDSTSTPDGYSLCVWDRDAGATRLILASRVEASGPWSTGARNHRYDDNDAATGARRIVLRTLRDGSNRVSVKLGGLAAGDPSLPVVAAPSLTAQWIADSANCWASDFRDVRQQGTNKLQAKSD